MTPNLRYNKRLTKKLVRGIPAEEDRIAFQSVQWHLENDTDRLFGIRYDGLFKSTTFFLQKTEKDVYRLVACDNQPLCGFFLIDDLERFMEVVGVQIIDLIEPDEIVKGLREARICPNTGIVKVDEDDKVFIYEHCDY